jgi:hypothetical protein
VYLLHNRNKITPNDKQQVEKGNFFSYQYDIIKMAEERLKIKKVKIWQFAVLSFLSATRNHTQQQTINILHRLLSLKKFKLQMLLLFTLL